GGSVVVGNGGTISLTGSGGGLYSSTGSGNYGIYLNTATISAGNGGSATNTITLTGIGGAGVGGSNYGIYAAAALTLTLNGSSASDICTFLNCTGGLGGTLNHGINISAVTTLSRATLQFVNVTGGGNGTANNYGLYINNVAVTAPTIISNDILGGPGLNNNYGLYISGASAALGGTGVITLNVFAGSLGTGSTEAGIVIDGGGSVIVGNGGSVTLVGTGGGLYSGTGTGNYGIYLNTATITAGNGNASTNSIILTGIGGTGTGGGHYGVYVAATPKMNLRGTGAADTVTFLNCTGGLGGTLNHGVNVSASLALVRGTLRFTNVSGGGSGTASNYGLFINNVSLSAPIILSSDLLGGPGFNNNYGLYVSGSSAVLGSTSMNKINVIAGSLGNGSNESGIVVDLGGSIVVGNGGTINLVGSGGGLYSSSGFQNYGIYLNQATLASGTGGSTLNTIILTGFGGEGTGGVNHGVATNTSLAVTMNGTNSSDSLTFLNCSGGGGGDSCGANLAASLSLSRGIL
ncbi:MAG: Uncharacterized protein FD130_1457, partial [Halothiobacillaceae bacterium]